MYFGGPQGKKACKEQQHRGLFSYSLCLYTEIDYVDVLKIGNNGGFRK